MAQRERSDLVDAMNVAGPDAATLCGEWTVRDLAAHLIVRERRPDAAPGILLKPFAGYLASVQDKVARKPFPELLELVRTGPPWWSPLKPVDALANLSEMFIHHEDVRRAEPGWAPRELAAADEEKLWRLVRRVGKMAYRASPVTVVLRTPGGETVTAKRVAEPVVSLVAAPSELLLHAFGRDQVRLETEGDPDAIRTVLSLDRSV
ncbi:uncharacterized protein (TIGR03085 family) [Nocardia puris]|uniref:Uncharacterized protein (TIGR03085 family) n=2 Tax=Nocardia puris TaxID=208602 RepID=A0A366E375_9NOCA|nr:uncharacterized protein (TIGR03085 family) [Nocardia puris]